MPFIVTTALKKISQLNKRIWALPGGSSAGKTIGAIEILIDKAQTDKKPTITSIVSESMPHIKRGAERDFKSIMNEQNYWRDQLWNATDHIYTFETGSIIEFFGADQSEKVKGPRRDRLFINEANNVPFNTFTQLEIRTNELIILDWNPSIEFWYYTEVKGKMDNVDEITLTYKDNEGLNPAIAASIEARRHNKAWFKVYGEGKLGEIEGKIFKDCQIIDEIPHEARLERTGLDFGFTNDPTAIVDIYYYNGGYIWDEVVYQWGMSNKDIANLLKTKERKALVIADSAEPKSIDEIKGYAVAILGVSKKRGESKSDTFVKWSIGYVQNQRNSITKRSVNIIKEYRNYIWLVDKNGVVLNEEDTQCANHAMRAGAYAMVSLKPQETEIQTIQNQQWQRNEVMRDRNSTR